MNIDTGFNLYIDITTKCNGKCRFCIAPAVGRKEGPQFWRGLECALRFTEAIEGTLQVVGGEPTISDRLPRLLAMLRKYAFRRVVVNTNGTKALALNPHMMASGVTHLNISRHHYDERKNNSIMGLTCDFSNKELAMLVQSAEWWGIAPRLQCNLVRGYIDSAKELKRYAQWSLGLGCTYVSFSQVFPLSLFDYSQATNPGYTEAIQVDLQGIVKQLDHDDYFHYTDPIIDRPSMWGIGGWGPRGVHRRNWVTEDGLIISLKTLAGYDQKGVPYPTSYDKTTDPELHADNLYFAVVHPDGVVTASWDIRERQLYNPYQECLQAVSSEKRTA